MSTIILRMARPEDAAVVAEIYRDYVENTTASLELKPPTAAEMETRILTCGKIYPFLICELDGRVVGYAFASRHFEQSAFDWSASISTFVAKSVGSKGIGRALLDALEGLLRAMGVINLYSLVTYNERSEYFHLARGFSGVGRLREAAYKHGQWRDLAYYEKALALHEHPPKAVRPVLELDKAEVEGILNRAKKMIKL